LNAKGKNIHQMTKVITYGTYDLLHQGHVNLLRRAKELGDYLIVGVTSDSFDRGRGKLNVRNNVLERVEAVKATGYADEVIIEDYLGQKIDDIQKYDVDIFAIGSDWEGKFDYLNEYCKVVYLPRTEGISSTMLRAESQNVFRIGVIGSGRIANRFVPETKVVNGAEVVAVLNPNQDKAEVFAKMHGIEACSVFNSFIEKVDAVYIASPHLSHYDYVKRSLLAGKHVLCEIPFVLNKAEAAELYNLAEERKLILLEASKTAYCPAFGHIVTLIKSGIIGDVVDVKASLSKMVSPPTRELDVEQAGGAMTEHAPLTVMAIVKLLGMDWKDVHFHTKRENGVDIYTKGVINYSHATSSFTLGIGVKTEGNLVVSGTKGYVYVPAPWWLTDYFEVRYEDQTKNKKYFYSYDGEGLRYEIQEFLSMIVNDRRSCYKLRRRESVAIAEIIEKYRNGENVTEI
jgi:glycerol-3-phosphate cytidylyltransferase